MKNNYNVIIIGAGPSGIAVAQSLRQQGVDDIVILEREAEAGGVPRHCQHPTFGYSVYHYPMKGNIFVKKLLHDLDKLGGVTILTRTTVTAINAGGCIEVSTPAGIRSLTAKKIVLATGARETPRHNRLVSGLRPQGVLTTGALQQLVYLSPQTGNAPRSLPFKNPVIVGSELVSFSALWTLRSAGIKARYMLEKNDQISAFKLAEYGCSLFGTQLMKQTKILQINGLNRVESVTVQNKQGEQSVLECDAVIFTGQFVGDSSLLLNSHLEKIAHTSYPVIDQNGQSSDPSYYFVGNFLHPVDTGDQCYQEGIILGKHLASLLKSPETVVQRIPVITDQYIRMIYPNCIRIDSNAAGSSRSEPLQFNLRTQLRGQMQIKVSVNSQVIYQKKHRCNPVNKVILAGDFSQSTFSNATRIEIQCEPVK